MSDYYDIDSLYPRLLNIEIGKRRYIEIFKIKSYIRKIKVRNKRKFIKRYKIVFNSLLRDDLPFKWYGVFKGDSND